jgi:hypothetical protein
MAQLRHHEKQESLCDLLYIVLYPMLSRTIKANCREATCFHRSSSDIVSQAIKNQTICACKIDCIAGLPPKLFPLRSLVEMSQQTEKGNEREAAGWCL